MKALIEKLPRDLPLYAHYVLQIFSVVLQSKDLTIIEDSISAFEAFCQHHDVATLAADQEHIEHYESIVRMYTAYAAQHIPPSSKGGVASPIAIRWRSAGLSALKSITASEAVGADGGRQMNIIMPSILQNLRPDDQAYLSILQKKIRDTEITEKELNIKRRMSNATVRTVEADAEPDSAALSGSTDDADRLAEEEVGLLALKSLKQIFVGNNRGQVRMGTAAMLRYICNKAPQQVSLTERSVKQGGDGNWATRLIEMVTRWAPVSDRFIILVTIMESLVRSPIAEENLDRQLVLATMVGWLLKSTINMIGLSVMDVLLGLIQHILLLLQLGGKGSNVLPHHQQTDAIDLFQDTKDLMSHPPAKERRENETTTNEVSTPSTNRQDLLDKLQKCIADLATHIYYSDQISDIITAILLRLKPSPMSSVSTIAAAIEHPKAAAQAISNSVSLQENPDTDEFFSFGTARVTALKAIRDVLTVANLKSSLTGGAAVGRNRVDIQVWEGTQWLLRDEDRRVRRAYVDALLTWLKLETRNEDLQVVEDRRQTYKGSSKIGDSTEWGYLTRRAVSNASHRERPSKPTRSAFLQLLHLAVYDNAIEAPESRADLLVLHLLLVSLIEKLGVNAVHSGLPMIMRLQEDINRDEIFSTPNAKLNIGSLVHGYLWGLSEKFDFDSTKVGHDIHSEISRRQRHSLWLDGIRIPSVPLDQIMSSTSLLLSEKLPLPIIQHEALRPFDDRQAMVDQIAIAYRNSLASPPSSPPNSPSRVFSLPILSTSGSAPTENNLPQKIKDAILSNWSKAACIAGVEKQSTRASSLNGSRTGTNLSRVLGLNDETIRNSSPGGQQSPSHTPPQEQDSSFPQQHGLNSSFRRASGPGDGSPTPISSSDQNSTLRVDDLKRVLASGTFSLRGSSPLRNSSTAHRSSRVPSSKDAFTISTGSESAVSAEGFESASEGDLSQPLPAPAPNPLIAENANTASYRSYSRSHSPGSRRQSTVRPSTSSTSASEDPTANAMALRGDLVPPTVAGDGTDEEVPPVPPLPAAVAMQKHIPLQSPLGKTGDVIQVSEPRLPNAEKAGFVLSDGNSSLRGKGMDRSSLRIKKKRAVDVEKLLGSIDAVSGLSDTGRRSGSGRPPY